MSYDLAVWEGERPANDDAAGETFERLMAEAQAGERIEPSPAIARYVATLLEKWPDIGEDDGDDSPWSDGPLINNASGPLFYFGMVFRQAEEASAFAVTVAREQGLVCFDPQSGALR